MEVQNVEEASVIKVKTEIEDGDRHVTAANVGSGELVNCIKTEAGGFSNVDLTIPLGFEDQPSLSSHEVSLKRKHSHDDVRQNIGLQSYDGSKKIKDCTLNESQVHIGSSEKARKYDFLNHYECPECPFNSQRKIDITRHVENHNSTVGEKCAHCSYRTTKSELKLHESMHEKGNSIQKKTIPETVTLDNNTNDNNTEEIKHEIPSPAIKSPEIHHSTCDVLTIEQIKSEEGNNPTSSNNNDIEKKIDNRGAKSIVSECSTRASNVRNSNGNKWFKCTAQGCPYKTNTLQSFKRHQLNHNHKGRLKCRYCSFSCKNNGILTMHLLEHVEAQTTISVPPVTKNDTSEKKYFICNIDDCPYTTNSDSQLKSHQFHHHDCNEPLKCPHCLFSCKDQTQWKVHLKQHDKELNHIGQGFANKAKETPDELQQTSDVKYSNVGKARSLLIPQPFRKSLKYDKKSRQHYYRCSKCPFQSTLKKCFITHTLKHKSTAGKKCLYCTFHGTLQEIKLHTLIHKKRSFKKHRATILDSKHIFRDDGNFSKACSSKSDTEATEQSKSDIMAVILKGKDEEYDNVSLANTEYSIGNLRKLNSIQPAHATSKSDLHDSDNESQDNIKAVILDGECCFINNTTKNTTDVLNESQEVSQESKGETLKAIAANENDLPNKHNHKITITITTSKENNDTSLLKSAIAEIFKSIENSSSSKIANDVENDNLESQKNGSTETAVVADILKSFNIRSEEGNLEKNKAVADDSLKSLDPGPEKEETVVLCNDNKPLETIEVGNNIDNFNHHESSDDNAQDKKSNHAQELIVNNSDNNLIEPRIFDDIESTRDACTEVTQLCNSKYNNGQHTNLNDGELNLDGDIETDIAATSNNDLSHKQDDNEELDSIQEPIKTLPTFTLSKPEIFEDIEYEGLLMLNKDNLNVQQYARKCGSSTRINRKKELISLSDSSEIVKQSGEVAMQDLPIITDSNTDDPLTNQSSNLNDENKNTNKLREIDVQEYHEASHMCTLSKPSIFNDIRYERPISFNEDEIGVRKLGFVHQYRRKRNPEVKIREIDESFNNLNGMQDSTVITDSIKSLAVSFEEEICTLNDKATSENLKAIDIQEPTDLSKTYTLLQPMIFDDFHMFTNTDEEAFNDNAEHCNLQDLSVVATCSSYHSEQDTLTDIDTQDSFATCNGGRPQTPTIFDDIEILFLNRDDSSNLSSSENSDSLIRKVIISDSSRSFSSSNEQEGESKKQNDIGRIPEIDTKLNKIQAQAFPDISDSEKSGDLNNVNESDTCNSNNNKESDVSDNCNKRKELYETHEQIISDNNTNLKPVNINQDNSETNGNLSIDSTQHGSLVRNPSSPEPDNHLPLETIKCEDCDCPYKTNSVLNLKKHMALHEDKGHLKCQYCTFSCKNQIKFKKHTREHGEQNSTSVKHVNTSKLYKCMYEECPYKTSILSIFKKHGLHHEQKALHQCCFCSFSSDSWPLLNVHLKLHTTDNGVNSPDDFRCIQIKGTGETPLYKKVYLCERCDYLNDSIFCIKQHVQRHKRGFEIDSFRCPSCLRKFNQKQNMDSHLKEHPECKAAADGLECSLCAYRTKPGANNLMLHLQEHVVQNNDHFNCPFCDMKHKKKEGVLYHIRLIHHKYKDIIRKYQRKMIKEPIDRTNVSERENDSLKECGRIKRGKEMVDQEITTRIIRHIEEQRNQQGNEQAASNSEQQELNQEATTIFRCKYCPTECSNEGLFKFHLKSHFRTGGIKCPHCTYRGNKTTILQHVLCHAITSTEKFHCPLCDTDKRTIENIVDHVKVAHSRAIFEEHDSRCKLFCYGNC